MWFPSTPLLSKSVFICLFLTASIFGKRTTPIDDVMDDAIIAEFSEDYVFLIMGGYRPKVHNLAKHAVSIRGGTPRKFFGDNHMCGGSIISKNIVLTAGHCVVDPNGRKWFSKYLVVAGTPFLFDSVVTMRSYRIKKEIVHPIFSYSTMRSDLALLISEKDFEDNGLTIQQIPLADDKPAADLKCTAVGWGRLFTNGPRPDEILYVNMTLQRRLTCAEYFEMNPAVICAADKNDYEKGVWKGDSGGPLICNGKLTGVVSFGFLGGGPNYFTNVYEHRDWILSGFATNLSPKLQIHLFLFLVKFFLIS